MTARIDTVQVEGGLEIVKMITSDTNISIPSTIDGAPVVSLGPMFLKDAIGSGNRSMTIPSSINRASSEALFSVSGLRSIHYQGDFETFNRFGWKVPSDCQVICADGFTFMFPSEHPMCFPDFDEFVLSSLHRAPEDIVMARLTDPVILTEENRRRYVSYIRSRTIPMAEHAIMENDVDSFRSIVDAGLLSDEDLEALLENSVRSGRTVFTSMIMSVINKRCETRVTDKS